MTMKVGTRVLFTIFLIIIIALCLFIMGTLFGLIDSTYISDIAYTMTSNEIWLKVLYAAIAAVLIIIALVLMFFGTRKDKPKTVNIASSENGSVIITVKAIEDLVHKHVFETASVTEQRQKVISYNEYIEIDVDIDVLPGVEIPALTKGLQDSLKEDLEKHTGIRVNQVRIRVMNIDTGMGSHEGSGSGLSTVN